MLEIYPKLAKADYKCPACGCQLSDATSIFFQGQHILADISCTCCDVEYFQTFPVGHGAVFPVSFTKDGSKSKYLPIAEWWMARPLIKSMQDTGQICPEIEIIKYKNTRNVVILNCLDSCWGHVFMKLLNAQELLSNEFGLVLLIPSTFKWLVPGGVVEIWAIDAKLEDFNKKVEGLDEFVKTQVPRFENVSLSKASIRPDLSQFDISLFSKTERFNLKATENPSLTFIWREDRFWHGNRLEEWVYLASLKFRFSSVVKPYFAWRQMCKFNLVAKKVEKKYPNAVFKLVGIGKVAKVGVLIQDLRVLSFTEQIEKDWCHIYSSSHVVIGVHGSNMLLPTALAGGFVDLVPSWKLERWGEDIVQPFLGGKSILLGRCVDGVCATKLVVRHVVSIIENLARK